MNGVIYFIIGVGIAIVAVVLIIRNRFKIGEVNEPTKSEADIATEVIEEILVKESRREDYNEAKEVGKD